ncbi:MULTISPECIES: NCS2 family permease [Brevibacillus]|uniref:NCS2 family permease n=1 Tax=Brevibacillus TaxID=55080 RepID=UPI000D0FDA98|nr:MULTISPECIES: NCS2 family permease [Brevibacillus]PSJ71083.1 guanine permease [Brevibacillus brevis]RED28676.1 AGZA family xanthine/uracil permease-like MFS transporter [Brevibacillus brevis]TQK62215.1 AGZA family xanthine/uracil permease-like MFS transporter [Brevibacillus sp. AG162]VEF91729.1 Guanine/hypoxanthine permease pbuG [Brevibacillus brevis]GEC93622.1 guanine permease [Brevibacillus brevis]
MRNYFEFDKLGTNYRREIIAGITTFLAMAYILAVNPFILSGADLPPDLKANYPEFGAVFTATALAAALGTLLMGILGRLPIGQAPGMGLNAFFTYTVVLTMQIPWQQALAGVFLSCTIFLILSLTGVREAIIKAIPQSLKYAVSAGIGLFIAFIGLKNAGIIVANDATFVALGHLTFYHEGMKPEEILAAKNALLAVFGLIVTVILLSRKFNAGIFIGMLITAITGMIFGLVNLPEQVVSAPPSLAPTFGAAFQYLGDPSALFTVNMLIVVLTFLFVDFFDATGTLLGVANQAGLLREDGNLPRPGKALASDAIAGMAGAVLGTSTTTAYVESTAGVAAGGRSGFTAVVTGIMFLLALFFSPILAIVTPAVTAPALIIVGVLMASHIAKVAWDDLDEAFPAFLTILLMPLTYSIATGIATGFIVYPVMKVMKGKAREVHPAMYVLFFVFLAYFIWLRE